jgi:hypothetical protein
MDAKPWERRAVEMRNLAKDLRDPYTKLELRALAELYQKRAERSEAAEGTKLALLWAVDLSRARCGRRIEPQWRLGEGRDYS